MQEAVHVQDMPRRLKSAARSIKTVLTETIKAKKPDMVVELVTGSADSKSKKGAESESTDLIMIKKAQHSKKIGTTFSNLYILPLSSKILGH